MWRSFDVAAVLRVLPDGSALAAGGDGSSSRIVGVRHAPTGDDLAGVGADELVVATAAAIAAAPGGADGIVRHLAAAQAAGVVVPDAPGPDLDGLLAAADEAALAVLTVPAGTATTAVVATVLGALLHVQRQRLDAVLDIHQRFTRIVVAGGGTSEVATALHELLGCPIVVLDGDGRRTACVPAEAGASTADVGRSPHRQRIGVGSQHDGEVVALTAAPLGEDGLVALERAATAIAMRLAQERAVARAQEGFAATTLEELVAGHSAGLADVAERARSFGWDLARPRAVLLASVDPPEVGTVPDRALDTIAAAARATLGGDAIVWLRSATVAALVAPTGDDPAGRRAIADALRVELDHRLRTSTVSIGVGRRVAHPSELHRSFVEASRAVEVGRWAKGRHVTQLYDELGLERLLAATPEDDLAAFVERAIGPLVRHDHANRTDLVETLAVWLETRNMAEAARRTHVHYNTLKNRMERIEAIVGPVLTDAAHALECEVALYVDRHYDVPWDWRATPP